MDKSLQDKCVYDVVRPLRHYMSKMRLCTIHKHQQPSKRTQRSAQSCPAQDVNTATNTALRYTEEINDKEEWEQHEKA